LRAQWNASGAPWINYWEYSSPFYFSDNTTPRVNVNFTRWYQSDSIITPNESGTEEERMAWRLSVAGGGGVPILPEWTAAPGTDQSMVIVDTDTNELWEFWHMRFDTDVRFPGEWKTHHAGWFPDHNLYDGYWITGSVPAYTNAAWGSTATSIALSASTIMDQEFRDGVIEHALGMIIPHYSSSHRLPAQRSDGDNTSPIRGGAHFRLAATFDETDITAVSGATDGPLAVESARKIAVCMRDYGFYMCDKAGTTGFRYEQVNHPQNPEGVTAPWGASGQNLLKAIPLDSLEVVDASWVPSLSSGEEVGWKVGEI
jgi:hypothetical protein